MKWFVLIGILLLFTACDCAYDYSYEITNETDGKLTVSWTHNTDQQTKTIVTRTSDILFITDHGLESCRKGPFFQEVNIDLDTISIWKDDTLLSNQDYRQDQHWSYEDGHYKAVVINSEF